MKFCQLPIVPSATTFSHSPTFCQSFLVEIHHRDKQIVFSIQQIHCHYGSQPHIDAAHNGAAKERLTIRGGHSPAKNTFATRGSLLQRDKSQPSAPKQNNLEQKLRRTLRVRPH